MPNLRVKGPDGKTYNFPDDATDQEITSFFETPTEQTLAMLPAPEQQAQRSLMNIVEQGPEARTQQARSLLSKPNVGTNLLLGAEKSVGAGAYGLANLANAGLRKVLPYGEKYIPGNAETPAALEPEGVAQNVGYYGAEAASLAIPIGGAAKSLLPSAARAGRKLQQVKTLAGHVPINVNAPGEIAMEAQRLAESGGQMPKVLRNYIQRVTDPAKADLTLAEARDFYSNATRLSSGEFARLTPVMQRQVGRFTQELGKAIESAAETTGQGKTLQSGLKEYHRAATLRKIGTKTLKKGPAIARDIGIVGVGGYAIKKMFE